MNDFRVARVTELVTEYRNLVNYISAFDINPPNQADYYTEGYSIVRRCYAEARRLAELRADTSPASSSGGEDERRRRELFK